MKPQSQPASSDLAASDAQRPSAYEKQSPVTKLAPSQAALLIETLGAMMGWKFPTTTRKARKPIPQMVCSPPEVIAAWNARVKQRSDRLDRIGRAKRKRLIAIKDNGQHPKFVAERVHTQHKHPLRDEHGAYTLTGGFYTIEGEGVRPSSREHVLGGVFCGPGVDENSEYTARRKWLAGISAQRGF